MQDSAPDHRAKAGRNDPCPCGSGTKFKKCCLEKDEQLEARRIPGPPPVKADNALTLPSSPSALSPRLPRELSPQEKAADALFERISALSGADAGPVDEILEELLKLPPGLVMWTDVLSEFATHEHVDLPAVYRRLAAGVPDTGESQLAYLHWEAADRFSHKGRTDLLPEVSQAFCRLHHDAYSLVALAFLEDALLAAHYEDEALRLAEHFLPRTREAVESGKLFSIGLEQQCALITDLRIGRLLRTGLAGEAAQPPVMDALLRGLCEGEFDEALLKRVAATLLAPVPAGPWARKDFALAAGAVGGNREILRAQELYLTLLVVARQACQKDPRSPGRTFHGLAHLLGSARQDLLPKRRGQGRKMEARGGGLLDYLEPSGLEGRIERACVRDMTFSRPLAQMMVDACAVLLDVAQEHQLLCADEVTATVDELARLRSKGW